MGRVSVLVCIAGLVCLWAGVGAAVMDPGILWPVDADLAGLDNDNSPMETFTYHPSLDAIGRYVAFQRYLAVPDDGEVNDVWVRDRGTGRTYLISNAGDPFGFTGIGGYSGEPVISADGGLVAFTSTGYGPWNPLYGYANIYRAPVPAAAVTPVSVNNAGDPAYGDCWDPEMTPDGRYVVFVSEAMNLVFGDNNGASDVFVRDMVLGTTEAMSVNDIGAFGDGASFDADISDNGRYVVFASEATNLGPHDTNNVADIFVRDRVAGTTTRITFSNWGEQADQGSMTPCISGDGRVVAYSSIATTLVAGDHDGFYDIYVYDLGARTVERASVGEGNTETYGDCFDPDLDYGGNVVYFEYVAFSYPLIYVRSRWAGYAVPVVSPTPDGACWSPKINRLTNYLAFTTTAGNVGVGPGAVVYTMWDGRTFADVPTFYWAYYQIEDLYLMDIVGGFNDPQWGLVFHPLDPVTRAAMAVVIARTLCGGDANVPEAAPPGTFTDVPPSHWAFKYVEYVYAHNIVYGTSPTTFAPDTEVDRAMVSVFMARAVCGGDAGVPAGPPSATFPDLQPTDPTYGYAYKYVEYLVTKGVVRGFDNGTFRPDLVISRDQMCVFVHRAFFE